MTPEEVHALQEAHGLFQCPKVRRRQRVVACMTEMLRRGHSEADVRAVVAGSPSAWTRARAWYREDKELEPGDPLVTGVHVSPFKRTQDRARTQQEQEDALEAVRLQNLLHGTSYASRIARQGLRQEMKGVMGADVGNVYADWNYMRARERREQARVERIEQEAMSSG